MVRLVYIAGRFDAATGLDRRENAIRAAHAAAWLVQRFGERGLYPVVPHALGEYLYGIGAEIIHYAGTMELMRKCSAVLLLPGWQLSKGSVAEKWEAERMGLPVFEFSPSAAEEIERWIASAGGCTHGDVLDRNADGNGEGSDLQAGADRGAG